MNQARKCLSVDVLDGPGAQAFLVAAERMARDYFRANSVAGNGIRVNNVPDEDHYIHLQIFASATTGMTHLHRLENQLNGLAGRTHVDVETEIDDFDEADLHKPLTGRAVR